MDPNPPTPEKKRKKRWIKIFWFLVLSPPLGLILLLFMISYGIFFEDLPTFDELENPVSLQASVVMSSDQKTLGRYYLENRNDVYFHELSPHLVTALICTEDERYNKHSGIDFYSLGRAVAKGGSNGGGSTITQQLAKMLFHDKPSGSVGRLIQKMKEWIIAVRLERQYTKEEILTMYLNKFDWIRNAVGIKSAAQVYYNKVPADLEIQEAAMLIGMAKNPSLFNPVSRPERALKRRNVVLFQMKRNQAISPAEYDSLTALPLGIDYHMVDHKEGMAPHFREELRKEIKSILNQKNDDGEYVIAKANGDPYSIYSDGLRIYTTIDSRMQKYAEWSVKQHLGKKLQKDFFKDVKRNKNAPFSNSTSKETINNILNRARKQSTRWQVMAGHECGNCGRRGDIIEEVTIDGEDFYHCTAEDCGRHLPVVSEDSILASFDTRVKMKIFSWNGDIDTVMTPNDSILYHKSVLQTGFMAVDPHSGFIKAWVGGTDYNYFRYDHVKASRRQVGSTIKPFVYAKALMRGYEPCTKVANIRRTYKLPTGKTWTPAITKKLEGQEITLKTALAVSENSIAAYIFQQYAASEFVDLVHQAGITSDMDTVPSLALGVMDASVYEMVGAYTAFANDGKFVKPIFVVRIEDKDGNVLMQNRPISKPVMDERLAYKMVNMMKGVGKMVPDENGKLHAGTGYRLRRSLPYGNFKYEIAGKTGTTQNNSDGWFMGVTPDLVMGCWVGADDRTVRFRSTAQGQGANMALPIVGYFLKKVYGDGSININRGDFKAPKGYRYDPECRDANDPADDPFFN